MGPTVAILLCTYNGEAYLRPQLDSLAAQRDCTWRLWVSDDGSSDATLDILRHYQTTWGSDKMHICSGPGSGPAKNFLSLVHRPSIQADYFAYCDQDDVWHEDKLARALHVLESANTENRPLLYGGRTQYVDEQGRVIGLSPHFRKPSRFANAIMQNIAGGNTMVFNTAGRSLLQRVPANQEVVMHDWWTYIVITACGGKMIYDPHPAIDYRQHDANQIGSNTGLSAKLSRLQRALQGRLAEWNTLHWQALQHLDACLSDEARRCLVALHRVRAGNPVQRLVALRRSGAYRQHGSGQLALYLLALLGRL